MNLQKFMTFKTIILTFIFTILAGQLFAQTTNGIFFQAVARDNFSNPAKDRKIYVQSSIIQTSPTGTKVLTEEHQVNTDATGVFSISLGNGLRVGGTASSLGIIDWSKGPFYLNLKVAITPISANSSWDYTKEWVDMGTTSFGAVPFALYSASSAKVDNKLDASDTTVMLKAYAKAIKVQSLETAVASKLTAADTLTMLAPYAKAAYTIDSNFFKSQLATKLSLSDTINYTKKKYTDSAFAKKLNISDSAIYVTKTQLANFNFSTGAGGVTVDTISLSNRINLKANTTELATLNASLTTEATTARAAELALTNKLSSNTASITSLTSYLFDQVATASAADETITNNLIANTTAINSLNTKVLSNTASITTNTNSIASEALTARAAELKLTNNIISNTSSITSLNNIITAATSSNTISTIVKRDASGNFSAASINATSINSPIYASAPQSLTDATTIHWNPINGLNASVTLGGNRTLSFSSLPLAGSYGTLIVTQDGIGGRTLVLPSTTNLVLGSNATTTIALSTAANAKDILNFYYDGINCYWNIGQGYGTASTAPFTLTTTGTGAATLSGNTLNIPTVSSTVSAGSISGTIAVANGGTGQTTIAGIQATLGLAGTKVTIGASSGQTNQGAGAVAIGNATGNSNQGSQSVAIGYVAGQANQGANSVAIGSNAAQGGQGTQSVAVGIAANSAANNATGIGAFSSAGYSNSTALGYQASTTAANTIQLGADGVTIAGSTAITNVRTSGTFTAGAVTYPNTHGTTGQVLSTTGSGTLTWTTAATGGGSETHTVGEVYGGGIVFYVTSDGKHGMIASSTNIGGTPHEFMDRVSSPSYHSTTTNGENLYIDWVAPTLTQLLLLYNARNTTGLNMGTSKYHSSTNDPNDAFGYRFVNFSNGTTGTVNGNWTDVNNGRGIRFF